MTTKSKQKITAAGKGLRAGHRMGTVKLADGQTLADVVLERSNPVTALHVLSYIATWGLWVDANGREPSDLRHVAADVSQSPNTLYRWQGKFRKVFPEYTTPALIWSQIRAQVTAETPEAAVYQVGAATV